MSADRFVGFQTDNTLNVRVQQSFKVSADRFVGFQTDSIDFCCAGRFSYVSADRFVGFQTDVDPRTTAWLFPSCVGRSFCRLSNRRFTPTLITNSLKVSADRFVGFQTDEAEDARKIESYGCRQIVLSAFKPTGAPQRLETMAPVSADRFVGFQTDRRGSK